MSSRQFMAEGVGFSDAAPPRSFTSLWVGLGGKFPDQFPILKVKATSGVITLSVVAEADAPTGMGGVVKIRKGGVTYAVYLVETTDFYASPVRIKTTTGVKAIRLKT